MDTPEFRAKISKKDFKEKLKSYDPGAFYVFNNNKGNVLAKKAYPQDANDKNPYAHRGLLRAIGGAVGGASSMLGGIASDAVDSVFSW